MPLALFVAMALVYLIACIAMAGIGVWLGARACRIDRLGWRRSMAVALAIAAMGAASWMAMESLPERRLPLSFWSSAVTVGALVLLMRMLGNVSWRRAAAGAIAGFVCAVLLSLPLPVAVRASGIMLTYRSTTDAMAPAIVAGDGVMADGLAPIRRWDVVVYRSPHTGEPYLHRVAGLPGETIEIAGGRIMIDGAPAEAPGHLASIDWAATARPWGLVNALEGSAMALGPGEYFVVGDNAEFSFDSRLWDRPGQFGEPQGIVPRRAIIGVARVRYGRPERFGFVR